MSARRPRVGLFGFFGSGNLGNDASVEAIMSYLRADHPDAVIDAMCMGWRRIRSRYGIDTVPVQWQQDHGRPGPLGQGLKVLGKGIDIVRTASWVRRHDVVIIPGTGIMDATLPINPWGTPLAVFTLTLLGRLLGIKVAMVSVGATPASSAATRRLYAWSARLVVYRTFRDAESREVLRRAGVDTSGDQIYPDIVWAIPISDDAAVSAETVGLGVMAYYGSNQDRDHAEQVYASYTGTLKSFVRWLVDEGRDVRLFIGDELDQRVVDEILADVREHRPGIDPGRVVGDPITTYPELVSRVGPASIVVATRFHNVLFSLKLGKPTISAGYSPKNDSLMREMGLGDYCQHARELDLELLKSQLTEIEKHRHEIAANIEQLAAGQARNARQQFAELSKVLFQGWPASGAAALS